MSGSSVLGHNERLIMNEKLNGFKRKYDEIYVSLLMWTKSLMWEFYVFCKL